MGGRGFRGYVLDLLFDPESEHFFQEVETSRDNVKDDRESEKYKCECDIDVGSQHTDEGKKWCKNESDKCLLEHSSFNSVNFDLFGFLRVEKNADGCDSGHENVAAVDLNRGKVVRIAPNKIRRERDESNQ